MAVERGELIHIELPWIYSVNDELKDDVCDYCMYDCRLASEESSGSNASVKTITLCSDCRQVGYCSNECQSQANAGLHGDECRYLAQIAKLYDDEAKRKSFLASSLYPRILLQAILRLERRQDSVDNMDDAAEPAYLPNKKLKSTATRKFKDLKSHWQEFAKDSDLVVALNTTVRALHKIVVAAHADTDGSDVVRDQVERLTRYLQINSIGELFGRIKINCLTIEGPNLEPIGQGLYLQTSAFDHSCRPNAYISFGNRRGAARVVATRRIRRPQDIRIAYCPVLVPRQHRFELLRSQYYFDCHCEACRDERGNALMLALKCPQCTSEVITSPVSDELLALRNIGKVPVVLPLLTPENNNAQTPQDETTAQRIASMPCTKCSQPLDQERLQFGVNALMQAMSCSRQLRRQEATVVDTKNKLQPVPEDASVSRMLHIANYYSADIAHSRAMVAYVDNSDGATAVALLRRVQPFYEDCGAVQGVGEMEYFVKLAKLIECDEYAKKQQQVSLVTLDSKRKLTTLTDEELVKVRQKITEILCANVGSDTALYKYWAEKLHL